MSGDSGISLSNPYVMHHICLVATFHLQGIALAVTRFPLVDVCRQPMPWALLAVGPLL